VAVGGISQQLLACVLLGECRNTTISDRADAMKQTVCCGAIFAQQLLSFKFTFRCVLAP
jgi:hypothetical protein